MTLGHVRKNVPTRMVVARGVPGVVARGGGVIVPEAMIRGEK